jgi:hypothetical protein
VSFPDRVYTTDEVKAAKTLVDQGYKHDLIVEGAPEFRKQVNQTLELIKTAGYYDFLRSYIRKIMEIDGIAQLRETEVALWANKFAIYPKSLPNERVHRRRTLLWGQCGKTFSDKTHRVSTDPQRKNK